MGLSHKQIIINFDIVCAHPNVINGLCRFKDINFCGRSIFLCPPAVYKDDLLRHAGGMTKQVILINFICDVCHNDWVHRKCWWLTVHSARLDGKCRRRTQQLKSWLKKFSVSPLHVTIELVIVLYPRLSSAHERMCLAKCKGSCWHCVRVLAFRRNFWSF
jgi:hypothetical protein